MTAIDKRLLNPESLSLSAEARSRLSFVSCDQTSEDSVVEAFQQAVDKFGPPQILVANAGITDESTHPPIWEVDIEKWDKVQRVNVRGTFLNIKHFLLNVKRAQESLGKELDNVSIVVTGSETGVFGQEGHSEYASGKAGLQYGLVKTVKNEIVRLNRKARVNAVAPGYINTALIGDRLDDPKERWAESEATVALRKIAEPADVAHCMVFLASHRVAGHISGQCISIDGGQEGRLLWREEHSQSAAVSLPSQIIYRPSNYAPSTGRRRRLRICLSIDFDAISGYLGTGHVPENTVADYSAGHFSANVGVDRLLRILRKHKIADKVTWFIPGHTIETFPRQIEAIVRSGAEVGLHGYSHEGASAMTVEQERDVIEKCISLVRNLRDGKKPAGYRAPLYQIRESTVNLLYDAGLLYDSSMNAYDSLPYFLPIPFPEGPPSIPDYSQPAETWMKPTAIPEQPKPGTEDAKKAVVEIPGSWYTEDMTPMGYYPYTASTQGYVATDVVEKMWRDRFNWIWENESWLDEQPGIGYGSIFPLIWHPESAGRSHIVGMIDHFTGFLVSMMERAGEGEITFETMESVALSWKNRTG